MCAAKFKDFEGELLARLPKNKGEGVASSPTDKPEPFHIYVDKRGTFYARNNPVPSSEQLTRILINYKEVAGEDAEVIIEGSPYTAFANVIRALNSAIKAGIKNISFTPPPESLK